MKFNCNKCGARYQINRERVANKTVKMRCKRCSNEIVLRDGKVVTDKAQPLLRTSIDVEQQVSGPSAAPRSVAQGVQGPLKVPAGLGRDDPKRAPLGPPGASAPAERPQPAVRRASPAASSSSAELESGDEAVWFVGVNGKPTGPLTLSQLAQNLRSSPKGLSTLVWRDSMTQWTPASNVPPVAAILGSGTTEGSSLRPARPRPSPTDKLATPRARNAPKPRLGGKGGLRGVKALRGKLGEDTLTESDPTVAVNGNDRRKAVVATKVESAAQLEQVQKAKAPAFELSPSLVSWDEERKPTTERSVSAHRNSVRPSQLDSSLDGIVEFEALLSTPERPSGAPAPASRPSKSGENRSNRANARVADAKGAGTRVAEAEPTAAAPAARAEPTAAASAARAEPMAAAQAPSAATKPAAAAASPANPGVEPVAAAPRPAASGGPGAAAALRDADADRAPSLQPRHASFPPASLPPGAPQPRNGWLFLERMALIFAAAFGVTLAIILAGNTLHLFPRPMTIEEQRREAELRRDPAAAFEAAQPPAYHVRPVPASSSGALGQQAEQGLDQADDLDESGRQQRVADTSRRSAAQARQARSASKGRDSRMSASQRAMMERMGASGGMKRVNTRRQEESGLGSSVPRGLTAAQLSAVVKKNRPGLGRCYELVTRGTPEAPSARLDVTVKIGTSGSVNSVDVEGSDLGALSSCLKRQIGRWRFPSADGASEVSFPLVFQPGA